MRTLQGFALALLFAPSQLWATPFDVTYTFTGSPGNQVSEAVDGNPTGALFSDITRGPGIVPAAGVDSMNSTAWTTGSSIDPSDYYEWTITPLVGFAIDLIEYHSTHLRGEIGPRTFEVRNSLDGFGAFRLKVATNGEQTIIGGGTQTDSGMWDVADLTAPVTFRIYAFDAEDASGEFRLGVGEDADPLENKLFMTVDITEKVWEVPEPATLVLFGTGAAGFMAKRRPGRQKAPARTETATVTGRRRRAACASRQRR